MATRDEALALAIEHHQQGRYDEAERIYLELHRAAPTDEEVLYLLGILCCDLGIFDTACNFLREALNSSPDFVDARQQLGLALAQAGKPKEALAQLKKVLAAEPERIEAHVMAAEALVELDRLDEAQQRLEQLLTTETNADAWRVLAKIALRHSLPALAEKCCLRCLQIAPDHTDALNLLGVASLQQNKFAEAIAPLARLTQLIPQSTQAHNNLGLALRKLGRLQEAERAFEQALQADGAYTEARVNLADLLRIGGRQADARAHLDAVLGTAPNHVAALNNLGTLLQDQGEPAQALAVLERAGKLDAANPQIKWNRALSRLALGDYARGWQDFEARWTGCDNLRGGYSKPLERAWNGEPIAGKRLLLWAEQGFGDSLQFVRFAKTLAEQGATVLLEAQPELVALLRSAPGVAAIHARGDALPQYDWHCPLMSLPLRLGMKLESLPAAAYVSADPARVEAWKQRIGDEGVRKVGLTWAGSSRRGAVDLAAIDARRSVSLAQLQPLLQIPGIRFFSLQKDGAAEWAATSLPADCFDFTAELNDFSDTAALIANLDLVISVDTAVVHLAGAMGKPAWLLNRYDSCWRWLRGRDDSPWYPTLRQFRQPQPGDWDTPIQRAATALRE